MEQVTQNKHLEDTVVNVLWITSQGNYSEYLDLIALSFGCPGEKKIIKLNCVVS